VMENGQGKRYIGLSADVSHRIGQHNDGESKWTRNKGPWVLIWVSCEMVRNTYFNNTGGTLG
ncbi:MAG TPA: GIY-YIG nuclease family protein, partial [Chthoniobacterales bacterium]